MRLHAGDSRPDALAACCRSRAGAQEWLLRQGRPRPIMPTAAPPQAGDRNGSGGRPRCARVRHGL